MNILFVGYIDAAGIGNTYVNAINKYTDHEARLVAVLETRGFPSDLVIYRDLFGGFNFKSPEYFGGEFKKLVDWCDVCIFSMAVSPGSGREDHKHDDTDYRLDEDFVKDILKKQGKKCFSFFFGSVALRHNYDFYIDICKKNGFQGAITCQPDIYFEVKKRNYPISYIPIMVDLANPCYRNSIFDFVKKEQFGPDKINIAHSPTNKVIKNTNEFLKVISDINSKNEKQCYSPVIIDNHGFYDSIMLKKMCHVGFDQMQYDWSYYCLSSVENMALGLINIVAMNDKHLALVSEDIGGKLPWRICNNSEELQSTMESIYDTRLTHLYDEMAWNYEFARTNWNDEKHIPKLIKILES